LRFPVFSKHRTRAMALPMTLVFILLGAVLVGVALYAVENMYSTSRQVVTETRLYNAAQAGIEEGKKELWENKASLDTEPREYIDDISDIYALDALEDISVDPEISVTVELLDCNYFLDPDDHPEGFRSLSNDSRKELPPQVPFGLGSGGGGGSGGGQIGYSNIIDPNRNIAMSGGTGALYQAFVIRATAFSSKGTQKERVLRIETMVVISHEE